jgi:hypothetical protein
MRSILPVLSFVVLGCSHVSAATLVTAASPFDGTWKREWTKTTPRGIHVVGSRTVHIRTTGVTAELSTLTLTQTISGVSKTLRVVQSCEATRSEVRAGVLTIYWSKPKLISPSPSEIPPGFHLWTEPVTYTYVMRGRELVATTGNLTDIFHRADPKT